MADEENKILTLAPTNMIRMRSANGVESKKAKIG